MSTIIIDFSKDLDDIIEDLFWSDQYFIFNDYIYILDTHTGSWYSIEHKYTYASLDALIDNNAVVRFDLIEDKEWIKELEDQEALKC